MSHVYQFTSKKIKPKHELIIMGGIGAIRKVKFIFVSKDFFIHLKNIKIPNFDILISIIGV